MTACDHIRPELGAYVLGALEPHEAETVREHLARCPACAAEHAQLAGLPELLALAGPAATEPPLAPAVEERVLDAVARERGRGPAPRRRWRWRRPRVLIPVAAVAAAALAALVIALSGGDSPRPRFEIALRPVAGTAAGGRAELAATKSGTSVHMWVRGLSADSVYEVQCDAPGWTASAGTFRPGDDGRAYVELTTAARRGEYDAIRVVRRSRAGNTDVLKAQL